MARIRDVDVARCSMRGAPGDMMRNWKAILFLFALLPLGRPQSGRAEVGGWALGSNSCDSSSGVWSARTNSIRRARRSGGYGAGGEDFLRHRGDLPPQRSGVHDAGGNSRFG